MAACSRYDCKSAPSSDRRSFISRMGCRTGCSWIALFHVARGPSGGRLLYTDLWATNFQSRTEVTILSLNIKWDLRMVLLNKNAKVTAVGCHGRTFLWRRFGLLCLRHCFVNANSTEIVESLQLMREENASQHLRIIKYHHEYPIRSCNLPDVKLRKFCFV